MYRVAVWDDNSMDLEALCVLAEAALREKGVEHSIDRFTSMEGLLAAIEAGPAYHLMLLDILCNGPEGITLAERLRERGVQSSIIFSSSSKEYVLNGYDVHAVNYLLKPPDPEKLADAIGYALLHGPRPQQKAALKIGGEWLVIELQNVVYLESVGHNVMLYMADNAVLKWRGKLQELAAQFSELPLAQCHNSFAVNLAFVRRIRRGWAELTDGRQIPISRSRAEEFKKSYLQYKVQ